MSGSPFLFSIKEREKVILLNSKALKEIQNGRWNDFSNYLKEAFKIERNEDGTPKTIVVTEEVLKYLDEWLMLSSTKLQDSSEDVQEVITEILRSLRNCMCNFESKKYVVEHTNILLTCDSLFSEILRIDQNSICLKILLQFLINLISSSNEVTEKVSNIFFERIKQCLQNDIHVYETSALLYNISLQVAITDADVISVIFERYNNDSQRNEFLSFFLEHSISKSYFWDEYKHFKIENKVTILGILRHMQLNKKPHKFPLVGLEILINTFLSSMDFIFQVGQEVENTLNIYEISLILEILSSLSSDEYYLKNLQNNKDLFINTGVVLINIHKLGKLSDNCFTPVQKLSEFAEETKLNEHPAFGFKADLIRLIGNMCWKNVELQNLARISELIPVILDCCNMDAKNPFIMQWAILAVRNLCDKNSENQKLIANLHQQGVVTSEVLKESGITLHNDGDNFLNIVPLESLKINREKDN